MSKTLLPKKDKKTAMNKFTICKCGTKICNKCWNYWHKDKTCLQAIKEELGEFCNENEIRLCRTCKAIVTKTEGCPHMSCSICKSDWCWDCGGKYNPGHYENCPKNLIPIKGTTRQRLREVVHRITSSTHVQICILVICFFIPIIAVIVGLIVDVDQNESDLTE